MARPQRDDGIGARHHVMNRGLARRPLFETERDIRAFLAALALSVRRQEIKVSAYCVMTTHFHLVVESAGKLSEAMARLQRDYVRWFNRGRKRDGALVRGRYRSKRILDDDYWINLIGYVDRNPVVAKMVEKPWDYAFGSAHRLLTGNVPRWLDPLPIARTFGEDAWSPDVAARYRDFIDVPRSSVDPLIERATELPGCREPWSLIGDITHAGVLSWMRRKAQLADGVDLGVPLAHVGEIRRYVAANRVSRAHLSPLKSRVLRDSWELLEIALLRDTTASTWDVIARHLNLSVPVVYQRYRDHRTVIVTDPYYRDLLAAALGALLPDLRCGRPLFRGS